MKNRIVTPGQTKRRLLGEFGEELRIPGGWAFLPAGDEPLTKPVRAKGATWLVQVTRKSVVSLSLCVRSQFGIE